MKFSIVSIVASAAFIYQALATPAPQGEPSVFHCAPSFTNLVSQCWWCIYSRWRTICTYRWIYAWTALTMLSFPYIKGFEMWVLALSIGSYRIKIYIRPCWVSLLWTDSWWSRRDVSDRLNILPKETNLTTLSCFLGTSGPCPLWSIAAEP